jgi:hypothetical protein
MPYLYTLAEETSRDGLPIAFNRNTADHITEQGPRLITAEVQRTLRANVKTLAIDEVAL